MKLLIAVAVCLCTFSTVLAHPDDPKVRDHQPPFVGPSYRQDVDGPMDGGEMRGPGLFASKGVELKSWITLSDLATLTGQAQDNGNDCWGYTSPSGREYAIMGLFSGTAFVEVTTPGNAQYVGYIDGPNSLWRDIKTYQNYAYAVTEGGGGIQVISLANIDGATNRVVLANTVTTDGTLPTTASHNVIINEQSGFLYRCGGGNNGLRIYSLANPATPVFVGQWSDRYVHDCQVVNYTTGPFAGREIAICCSGFNGGQSQTGLDFLDVTDKQNIINLYPARVFWPNAGYSHQLWLSPDRNYAYVNDELDEGNFGINTRTIVVDTRFLLDNSFTAPSVASTFDAPSSAIGHNLYTLNNLVFEANYRSGLRIFCAENQTSPDEVAFFDTYPDDDAASFNGAWSNYPYFPSGTVIVSDLERGLFVLDVSKATHTLQIAYPLGHPQFIDPDGTTAIRASVQTSQCGTTSILPGSVTLYYDVGGGYVGVPMVNVGGSDYEAYIGASVCGTPVAFFVSAQNNEGDTFTNPAEGAANAFDPLAPTAT
ncbi:MAG: choice-of-anchor B family protein [Planctomycetes bacterium]|nr:choice-of-anchor B family protein [Planctomycetota bacterium]